MNISEIINILKYKNICGLQVSKRNGVISTTWILYKKGGFYYYFDINQTVEFVDKYKYSEEELKNEFKYSTYNIDLTIS
ncbi:MAG: hypothetical protein PHD00_05220 [Bacteroidales bacterium]|nr:hypothetical protein [Bacteroidales bacterium]MDD4673677.1 hypothetical protein [Bacteroidales bacterium]MDY0349080.1 hypothetical protein [Tenuifilaceae bacterium]